MMKVQMFIAVCLVIALVLVAGCRAPLAPTEEPAGTGESTACYRTDGGDKWVCASGGEMQFESGSTLDIQSGTTTTFGGASTMSGVLAADGGITVDTNAFTVADATGATTMGGGYNNSGCTVSAAGVLKCDGAVVLDSTLAVTGTTTLGGALSVDSPAFTVADTSGNVGTAGTLTAGGVAALNAGITVDTSAFTVTDSTGATTMAGGYGAAGCTVDTSGNLSCNGTGTFDGALTVAGVKTTTSILAKDASYAVLAGDTGSLIKSSGSITMTLPAAAAGLNYCIVNFDGGDLTIDFTDATDVALNEVNSPGERITNTTNYDSICLTAIDTTNWMTISSLGTWADGN